MGMAFVEQEDAQCSTSVIHYGANGSRHVTVIRLVWVLLVWCGWSWSCGSES